MAKTERGWVNPDVVVEDQIEEEWKCPECLPGETTLIRLTSQRPGKFEILSLRNGKVNRLLFFKEDERDFYFKYLKGSFQQAHG